MAKETELSCENCPEKVRCDEQKQKKYDTLKYYILLLETEENKTIIKDLWQHIPTLTRCDVVLEKALKRKEQELQKLKKELESAKYEANMWQEQANIRKEISYSWQQQHDKLQADLSAVRQENEKLKEKKENCKGCSTCNEALNNARIYAKEYRKCKKALDIIPEVAEMGCGFCVDDECERMKQILFIIKQAKGEE